MGRDTKMLPADILIKTRLNAREFAAGDMRDDLFAGNAWTLIVRGLSGRYWTCSAGQVMVHEIKSALLCGELEAQFQEVVNALHTAKLEKDGLAQQLLDFQMSEAGSEESGRHGDSVGKLLKRIERFDGNNFQPTAFLVQRASSSRCGNSRWLTKLRNFEYNAVTPAVSVATAR